MSEEKESSLLFNLRELMSLEESTRDRRRELNKELKKTLDGLSEKERKAFMEKAKKRHAEMASRFVAVVKEYPEDKQARIRNLISTLTR